MRIEVQIGHDDPKIYPLKESKLTIGSGENAHIQLPATEGISRKHAQISVEGDKFFITDLGSANGTFINEDRLVPGTKKEFTSFFPVRLADNVTISLLSDDEPMPEGSSLQEIIHSKSNKENSSNNDLSNKTQIISRSSFDAKPKSISSSKKSGQQKIPEKKKKETNIQLTYVLAAFIVLGAFGYHFFGTEMGMNNEEITPSSQPVNNPPENPPITPTEELAKQALPEEHKVTAIGPEDIPKEEEFKVSLNDIKCATTLEKKLCEIIPEASLSGNGALESIGKVIIVVPEKRWLEESLTVFRTTNVPPFLELDQIQRTKLLTYYLFQAIAEFNWEELEKNLFFVFYHVDQNQRSISSIVGIKSKDLTPLLKLLKEKFTPLSLQQYGKEQLKLFDQFLTIVKYIDLKNLESKASQNQIPVPQSTPIDQNPAVPLPPEAPSGFNPVPPPDLPQNNKILNPPR